MPLESAHRAMVLDAVRWRRDFLRTIIKGMGVTPFCFENDTAFLDNLESVAPDLVVAGPMEWGAVLRVVNLVKMTDAAPPAVVFYKDRAFRDRMMMSGFDNVWLMEYSLSSATIEKHLKRILDGRNRNLQGRHGPLMIGTTPEMLYIKKLSRIWPAWVIPF